MPFSVGARDCAGQSLARMNYTTTVAMLLSHFSFKLAAEVRLDLQQHVSTLLNMQCPWWQAVKGKVVQGTKVTWL